MSKFSILYISCGRNRVSTHQNGKWTLTSISLIETKDHAHDSDADDDVFDPKDHPAYAIMSSRRSAKTLSQKKELLKLLLNNCSDKSFFIDWEQFRETFLAKVRHAARDTTKSSAHESAHLLIEFNRYIELSGRNRAVQTAQTREQKSAAKSIAKTIKELKDYIMECQQKGKEEERISREKKNGRPKPTDSMGWLLISGLTAADFVLACPDCLHRTCRAVDWGATA